MRYNGGGVNALPRWGQVMKLDAVFLSRLKESQSPHALLQTLIEALDAQQATALAVYNGLIYQTKRPISDSLSAWLSQHDAPAQPIELEGGCVYPLGHAGQSNVIVFLQPLDEVLWLSEWLKLRLAMLSVSGSSLSFETTKQRLREMSAMNNISELLSNHFGSDTLWSPLQKELRELFPQALVSLCLIYQDTLASPMLSDGTPAFPVPPEPLVQTVVRQNATLIVNNFNNTDQLLSLGLLEFARNTPLKAWIGTPLYSREGQLLGVLSLYSHSVNAFQEADISALKAISAQLALALDNTRLLNEATNTLARMERRARRLASLHMVATMINSTLDIQEILARSAKMLVELFHIDHVGVVRMSKEDNNAYLVAEYPYTGLVGTLIARSGTTDYDRLTAMMRSGKPFVLNQENYSQIIDSDFRRDAWLKSVDRTGSSLILPLVINEYLLGSIGLDSLDPNHRFSDGDIETFATISAQIAVALHNAQLYEEAVLANRLKSEFLANISHELRTPLNAIIGYTEMLLGETYGRLNEKQSDRLGRVHKSGKSLLTVINDILDLSKIEAGRLELELMETNVGAVLKDAISTVASLAEQKGIALNLHISDELPSIQADPQRLHQVVLNLLSNAVKFTHKGAIHSAVDLVQVSNRVIADPLIYLPNHLSSVSDGYWLLLRVRDSGIGIDPKDQRTIFEAFRQVDGSSVREYEGTGLGLAITQRLVKLHQGFVWVDSMLGEGSTFYVLLPSAPPADKTVEIPTIEDGRPLVLVIDDDVSTLQLTEDYISHNGYRVVATREATHAIMLAKRLKPSAIITDVVMPHMDGWEILRQLKSDPETQPIPVIVLSILDKKTTGIYLGASDYLIKPVSQKTLLDSLARFVNIRLSKPILIVDDRAHFRQLVEEVLTMLGYPVVTASTGEEALEWLAGEDPSMLILDIMMPGISGFEVMRVVRERDIEAKIPIVIVTSRDLTTGERRKIEAFNAQWVSKQQMTGKALAERVRIALNRRLQQHNVI